MARQARQLKEAIKHYQGLNGENYLKQRESSTSERVQRLRASVFEDVADERGTIVDFGCGTGGVISLLPAKKRIGIEIGEKASELAISKGVQVYKSLGELEANTVDVVISFHALEHVENPGDIIKEICRVIRPGGKVRIVVPLDTPLSKRQRRWMPNNEQHIYAWTPLTLGNLVSVSGLIVQESSIQPMATNSRIVRSFRSVPVLNTMVEWLYAFAKNRFNVVVDAKKGDM